MELSTGGAVPCGKDKFISRNELLLHLKTYNIYYEGQNLQLRHREEEGELIVEGLLNISWGLRRPIRLQMQDDNQRIRPPPSSSSWHSGCNLGAHGSVLKPSTLPDIQVTDVDTATGTENPGNGTAPRVAEEAPQLMRTRSDVGVRPRGSARTAGEQRRLRRHRFSINGHFYNHKTSVFTPAYGSVTNVRINSTMTTPQVLKLLLNKFKIENSAEEFALYMVHTSGGRPVHQIRDAHPQELHPEAGGGGGPGSEEAEAQVLHPAADDRAEAGGDLRGPHGHVSIPGMCCTKSQPQNAPGRPQTRAKPPSQKLRPSKSSGGSSQEGSGWGSSSQSLKSREKRQKKKKKIEKRGIL
ncbi:ras association domain-containing protein 2 isoform X1 [Ammospiza caudacuta]|uniref:ras association domain-containing protein 2 isoform X1 n=1 Tax=Ammospiza caudacuta TaxID=2857398 RepID=UPI0027392456|nr:ras association domain-containing protein 2 isoform X1 [Ammospiza caudacuta]XP_058676172.1 ras association domain-containing protein 2 isoform X1 [Ammospiza caudacuta]XP_058676173.1 ras association domain-containing protein 2 isoform X1 [Ammospiza caudacuta]XP_058676174.1 ras association domain-containing protein 2 isoform X1 [Ammospiza caudacuta]